MTSTDIPYAIGLSALFFVIFGGLEWGTRRYGWSPDYTRRFAHIVSGLLVLLDYALLSPIVLVTLVAGSTIMIAISQRFRFSRAIHYVSRRTYGEVFLSVGFLAAFAVDSDPDVFIPSVLIITFADSLAGITTDMLRRTSQTIAGSLVFFVATVFILTTTTALPPLFIAGAALALTTVERLSPWGSDNLTVPLTAAVLLTIL